MRRVLPFHPWGSLAMRLAEATASPILFRWAGTLLVATRVSSTPRSLTWTATWAPNASAIWRRTALAPPPEARMTDSIVRLTTIPVVLSSSGAATKLPTMSVAAFLRSPWANSLQSSA